MTANADLVRLRAEHGARWDIAHAATKWYALRRGSRPVPRLLSAYTPEGLWHDLACVEEASR